MATKWEKVSFYSNPKEGQYQRMFKLPYCAVLCIVAQSCPALCDLMDCSPPGTSVHGDSPGQNTGVDCHALLQGILPTQGLTVILSYASKVMLNILQTRLQQYVNEELPDVQAEFQRGREIRVQIANICWIMEKAKEFHKKLLLLH